MASPVAVYHVKPHQLSASQDTDGEGDLDLTFNLDLEHRVWLSKWKVDRRRPETDPARLDWDSYEPELCAPDLWQPSWLSTAKTFGGSWDLNVLRPSTSIEHDEVTWGPMPGDRVVVYRTAPNADIVGVWLITGARYRADGAVSYSHRPLVSCLNPVPLRPSLRLDADLAECWDDYFGRRSRVRGRFMPLEGAGLSALMRTVGIDPQWLCGPTDLLPDCSMSNVLPDRSYRAATRLRTGLSPEAVAESRAIAETVDWLLASGTEATDVETMTSSGRGACLVARCGDDMKEVVALGVVGASIDDIELCPTIVYEAVDAVESGRSWSLMVTLDACGPGRTLRFDALAVATCFDPTSGRVNMR
jgi:hypothetical protein